MGSGASQPEEEDDFIDVASEEPKPKKMAPKKVLFLSLFLYQSFFYFLSLSAVSSFFLFFFFISFSIFISHNYSFPISFSLLFCLPLYYDIFSVIY